jgi:hypothetical protein
VLLDKDPTNIETYENDTETPAPAKLHKGP